MKKLVYIFRRTEFCANFKNKKLTEIFEELNSAFKINPSLRFVLHELHGLQHCRYYYPADNHKFFQFVLTLAIKEDLHKLKKNNRAERPFRPMCTSWS